MKLNYYNLCTDNVLVMATCTLVAEFWGRAEQLIHGTATGINLMVLFKQIILSHNILCTYEQLIILSGKDESY